jgi:hypothetical protein
MLMMEGKGQSSQPPLFSSSRQIAGEAGTPKLVGGTQQGQSLGSRARDWLNPPKKTMEAMGINGQWKRE